MANAGQRDNVKQMAVAFLNHESAQRHLPTGGWGYRWVGDPDGGYARDQPGGWAYNILEYMEQGPLRSNGKGIANATQKQEALLRTVTSLLPIFNCPSKRPLQQFPVEPSGSFTQLAYNLPNCSVASGCRVMRNDYRVNGGNTQPHELEGPPLGTPIDSYVAGQGQPVDAFYIQSGICFRQSAVRIKDILDGTSNTTMLGEKYLSPERYEDGNDRADDQCIFTGHDRDNVGYTVGNTGPLVPLVDSPNGGSDNGYRFGSSHPGSFNMAFCDGSVQDVSYDVDPEVYRYYGGRDDGR